MVCVVSFCCCAVHRTFGRTKLCTPHLTACLCRASLLYYAGKVTFDLMTSGYKTLLAADPTNAVAANGLAVFRVLSRFGCVRVVPWPT